MASGMYNYFKAHILDAEYNLASDTIKCALMNNTHAFDATNDVWADVSANEITGTGYTAGGQALTGQSVTIDDVNNKGVFGANDVSWTSATFTAYHTVLYDDTHLSDALMISIDFGGAQTVTGNTFTIQWSSGEIINIS